MPHSNGSLRTREIMVIGFMGVLFLFWLAPISLLTTLLSYEEIKKAAPWLGRLIDSDETIRALVQNAVPTLTVVVLNSLLPFVLESTSFNSLCMLHVLTFIINAVLCYMQGHKARSWVEYSLLKKSVWITLTRTGC